MAQVFLLVAPVPLSFGASPLSRWSRSLLLVAQVPRPSGASLFFSLSPAPLGSTGSSFAAQDSTIFSDLRQDAPGPAPTYGETCTTVLLPCGDGTVAPLRVLSRRD